METASKLYPDIEPYKTDYLKVSDLHDLYYEESGNKDGKPILFLHGGPGSGTSPKNRRFFDPDVYKIVLFDQRGAGKSKPLAELKDNTTWDLVEDIEKLRKHLGIDTWVVFGGSWGSTLSLAYAETHPCSVKALILRGIYTNRRWENIWSNQKGASYIFPDFWEKYLEPIPEVEQHDLMSAYYRRLTGNNHEEKIKCAKAWNIWVSATSQLYIDHESIVQTENDDDLSVLNACIECHYFVHGGFLKTDTQLLDGAEKIKDIPCTIVQGRYDMVCPMSAAWDLHKRLPLSELQIVPDAGHSSNESGTTKQLLQACEKYKIL